METKGKKKAFEEAFDNLIQYTLHRIERDKGEHIYFENNPADPTLPRMMRNINTARLEEFMWLQYSMKHSKNLKQLTKEEVEKIVSAATPTSKNWSETHKQIFCTTIPCTCCNAISMIVIVSSQGRNYGVPEESVDGFYRIFIDLSENEISVKTYKLEEKLITEKKFRR